MKRLSLLLLASMAIAGAGRAATPGDVTGDGVIDVEDVNAIINIVLGKNPASDYPGASADVNGDGVTDVEDMNTLINVLLGRETLPEPDPDGYAWVWDMDALPEIHIEVSLDEWNRLLDLYDANSGTKQYVTASHFTFVQDGETTVIDSIGLRLKGNTSRRRPEGSWGEHHNSRRAQWRHVHFGVNLRKYHKDDDHTLRGVRKLHLKWFKDDADYCREVFCYDLFRRAGVWTASRDNYCRLWLRVAGDSRETYYGIYEMIEPVDENYLKQRDDDLHFGTHKGNLWKCKYVGQPANLTQGYDGDYWYDDDTDASHTYTLHTNTKRFDNARAQLIDFQLKLNGKGRESFYNWIKQVCDVDLLLRTYAVSVATGMWDDYWNNGNNYYLYFTTEDIYDYQFYLIPYDYDNTLGTSLQCGNQNDAGRQNPTEWGLSGNRLIQRLMEYDDFRATYIAHLKDVVAEQSGLMHYTHSMERIRAWHDRIRDYVSNDTGEDMTIGDWPAYWGNHGEYRLLETGGNNFFQVKASVINALQ